MLQAILVAEQLIAQCYGQGTVKMGSKMEVQTSNPEGQEMYQFAVTSYCVVPFSISTVDLRSLSIKKKKQQQKQINQKIATPKTNKPNQENSSN